MPAFLHHLSQLCHTHLERYRHRPFLRAAMAACALVAQADGRVTFRQRACVDRVMETLDSLKLFDPHEGVELFNEFVTALRQDSEIGHRLARAAVATEVAEDPEKARLLVRICLVMSERDGIIPPPQRHEIEALCHWLGLDAEVEHYLAKNHSR